MLPRPGSAPDPFRGSIRSSFRRPGFRYCCEARPRHFTGPQGACHTDELELSVVEQGISTFALDQRFHGRLSAGEFGVVPPTIEHSSWTHESSVLETNLHFGIDRIGEAVGPLGLNLKEVIDPNRWLRIESLPVSPGMRNVLSALRFEASGVHRPCTLTVDCLATALLAMVLREAGARPLQDDFAVSPRSGVRRAADLMRSAPEQAHSLDDLAATAGLSRFHFLRAFRKEHGLPPHGFLVSLRLDRAEELIRTTELSLTVIAYEAGFGSSSRLTEAFQKRFGVSPSLWRKGGQAISGSTRSNQAEAGSGRLRHTHLDT